MKKQEFINLILIEIESDSTATLETELSEISEWDSLASMITIGLIYEHFDVVIKAPQLGECITFNDITNLCGYDFTG